MKLIDYLNLRKISQREFAKIIGYNYIYINNVVTGKKIPGKGLKAAIEKSTDGFVKYSEIDTTDD